MTLIAPASRQRGLRIRESGPRHGEPVLLLHSLFFDGSMFDALIAEVETLSPGRYRFIAPDHRGQGASGDGPVDLASLAEDAASVLTGLCGDAPAHVVGSSMGGYVGTFLAAAHPDQVRTCTLMGGTADEELDPAYFADLERAISNQEPDVVDRIEYTMFGDAHLARPLDDPRRAKWRDRFAQLPPRVAAAAHAVFTRPPLHSRFAAVTAPVLLIAGETDHAKPPEHMERMAFAKPSARLAVLANVGHTPAIEAPGGVALLLDEHWGAAPRAAHEPTLKPSLTEGNR